ncbi:hypothetical protein TNCV_200001 [Trichonephila clavipes]|nr:hypothetical protein TNCV_200001 [Trichonephila clavipes]
MAHNPTFIQIRMPIWITLHRDWTKGSIEYIARSSDLTAFDFYLGGYRVVNSKKPSSLEELRFEIDTVSPAIPTAVLRNVTNNVWHRARKCLEEGGLQLKVSDYVRNRDSEKAYKWNNIYDI